MTTTIGTPAQGAAAQAQAEAREAAQAAREAAQDAAQAVREAQAAASLEERIAQDIGRDVERALQNENISVTTQGSRRIIELPNGQRIVIGGDEGIVAEGVPTTAVLDDHERIPMMAIQTGKQVAMFFFFMLAFIIVGLPVARAFARWLDRKSTAQMPPEVLSRLASIENAVETVAVEVERISEGQRFTTRLLNERAQGVPVGASDRLG